MKKLLSLILGFVFLQNVCFAGVSFLYINGSNNNDEKSKVWFENGIEKLHPAVKEKFEKNPEISRFFENNPQYKINEEPILFFWGDRSKKDLEFVQNQLDFSKALSPTLAYKVRSIFASCMHDAIWVQKQHNMLPILDDLNKIVIEEANKGNNVVLYGYSAGTFVTYEYLLNKLRYINPHDLFNTINVSDDVRLFVEENPVGNTCISALSKSGIGVVSQEGHLLFNNVDSSLKSSYLRLKEVTEVACAPQDNIEGVINFASPLVLFYSDLADPDYELNYYNKLMMKYIMEKGLFFVTINYREDPLGFPTSRNLTISEMEKLMGLKFINPKGFVYDNSSVWSKRSFVFAHTSYWSSRRAFSKALVKAFTEGYKYQYGCNSK